MSLTEGLTLIGSAFAALVSGGYAILQIHFNLKAKYIALVKVNEDEKIERMSREIQKLTSLVDTLSLRLDTGLRDFTGQVHAIALGMAQTAGKFEKQISDTREGFIREIGKLAERLALLTSVAGKLEEKYLGEGMYRVEPKKPKG